MKLLLNLRSTLARRADRRRAIQMQAYMKSKMAYHGVPSPSLRQICRELFRDLEFSNQKNWESTVRKFWRGAKFREERYGALILTGIGK